MKTSIEDCAWAVPLTEVKIVSAEDSSVLVPAGQPGELAIGGPQVFQ